VNATAAVTLGVLGAFWLLLLFLTFRPPDAPRVTRLIFFLGLLGVTVVLAYLFLVGFWGWNPNPLRVEVARTLTKDNMIYLGDIVPGTYDLDYVERVDTDWADETLKNEWLASYQYDVKENPDRGTHVGPFGGAIYDYDDCRPPAILSFELVPVSYDYLGQNGTYAQVDNIIPFADPVSANQDRPEVIINGVTRGVVTDLNVFRKVGVELNCLQKQQWQAAHPGETFPNPLSYQNIGSFRGNYRIVRSGSTVTVVDSGGFERSQFVVKRQYRPEDGSYFQPGTQILHEPVEYSLDFGPGQPDEVTQVYYPEKAVLAFYLNLGMDETKLEQAKRYLSPGAQGRYDMEDDTFGLSTDTDSVAQARDKLARVLVWEIRYHPDVEAEQMHKDRQVEVTVVGVNQEGYIDYAHPCQVTWVVIGEPRTGALPYNCEWRLDRYQSTCPPASR
jgi:hypothetical protein